MELTQPLHQYYKWFLDSRILKQYQGFKFLTSALILKTVYIAVIQNGSKIYLCIDNVNKPCSIDLNASDMNNPDGYMRFNQDCLKYNLPKEVYSYLLKQGLYMEHKENRGVRALSSVHRLIKCITENITGYTVNHDNRIPADNHTSNLTPMTQEDNTRLRNILDIEQQKQFIEQCQQSFTPVKKRSRSTLQTNINLHLDIIKYAQSHTTKETIKHFKKLIKTPQTIRNIINLYRYAAEFISYIYGVISLQV